MKNICPLLILLMFALNSKAQDIQYSQFYANKLFTNPAFAGSSQMSRATAIARWQWISLDATYLSSTFSFDHHFEQIRSGVGIIFTADHIPFSNLNTTDIGLQYAYQVELSEKVSFRPGIQLSYVSKSIDYSLLDFSSQYNNNGFQGGSSNEIFPDSRVSFADISAGGLVYGDDFWIGVAGHHLNSPDQSFLNRESKLPVKLNIHAGYKIYLKEKVPDKYGVRPDKKEYTLSPAINYKAQGKSDQFDIGLYLTYEMFVLGGWYRGLELIKRYESSVQNSESLVALVGITYMNLIVGYSYDFTISRLTKARTYGSHELSIVYQFDHEPRGKKRPKFKMRKPVCPRH